jgi:ferritin-like metal-binding protein YciE
MIEARNFPPEFQTEPPMTTKEKTKRRRAAADADAMPELISGQGDLMKLLISGIRDIYWAENHLVRALPKMRNATSSAQMRDAIADHLEVTKEHVTRLGQIFGLLGQDALARKCDAMEGLTLEGEGTIEDTEEGTSARDLGINFACQKVEHYEIAAYQGLINLATALGLPDVAKLLTETLNEEHESSDLLLKISEGITADGLSEN